MKNPLVYIAFVITVTYSCTSEAQLSGDDSARRAVLELRDRIQDANDKSVVSICEKSNTNVNVGEESLGEIELNQGDTQAREAIKDLRKRVILLEVSCEIASKNFIPIPSPIGYSPRIFGVFGDDELRRAILDLRQRLEKLREKIKDQVAQKNQNIETERINAQADEAKRKQVEDGAQIRLAQQTIQTPLTLASVKGFGLSVTNITDAQKSQLKIKGGVRVESLTEPAIRAGLREGDVILAVANIEVSQVKDFAAALSKLDKSKPVNVLFRREELTRFALVRPIP